MRNNNRRRKHLLVRNARTGKKEIKTGIAIAHETEIKPEKRTETMTEIVVGTAKETETTRLPTRQSKVAAFTKAYLQTLRRRLCLHGHSWMVFFIQNSFSTDGQPRLHWRARSHRYLGLFPQ